MTVRVKGWVSLAPLTSVTWTVKLATWACVGVPDMTPSVPRLNPVGNVPADRLQVRGAVPSTADRVWL